MIKKNLNKQSRNIVFDLLKIVLIFLVVNIHIRVISPSKAHLFGSYWSYTVPIFITLSFFFMSKYFSEVKLSFSIILSRIKRFLFPLIFWSGVGFLLNPKLFNIRNSLLQLLTGKVVDTPLYYLNILILFTLIFWLITYLPSKFRVPLHVIIIIAALTFDYSGISYRFFNPMINEVKRSYGQIDELIKYASLGILFGMLAKQKKKKLILFSFVGLTLLLLNLFKFPQPPGFNYSGIELFFGTIFVLSFALLIGDVNLSPKINSFINIFGTYSFGVYLFHIIFLEKLFKFFPNLKYFNNLFPFQFLLLYTSACYCFCFLFDYLTLKKLSFLVK